MSTLESLLIDIRDKLQKVVDLEEKGLMFAKLAIEENAELFEDQKVITKFTAAKIKESYKSTPEEKETDLRRTVRINVLQEMSAMPDIDTLHRLSAVYENLRYEDD